MNAHARTGCGDQRGTVAGWARNRRRDEPPCEPCAAAERAYQAAWRKAARERRVPLPPCVECGGPRKPYTGARGWCHRCYQRWLYHGNPSFVPSRAVDVMAVERAVFGDRPAVLTTAERELVVKRLNRLGLSDARIAEHLDIGKAGVWRIRNRLGVPAVPVDRRIVVAA